MTNIYDEAGRFLARERHDDPAFLAHQDSHRRAELVRAGESACEVLGCVLALDHGGPHTFTLGAQR